MARPSVNRPFCCTSVCLGHWVGAQAWCKPRCAAFRVGPCVWAELICGGHCGIAGVEDRFPAEFSAFEVWPCCFHLRLFEKGALFNDREHVRRPYQPKKLSFLHLKQQFLLICFRLFMACIQCHGSGQFFATIK